MDNHNYMYLCIYRQISRLVHPNLLIVRLSSSSEHCPMSAELSKSGQTNLIFSMTSWNNGAGPLELRAGEGDNTTGKQKVYQRVFLNDGNYYDRLAGSFDWHPAHNHFHFNNYALYTLQPVDAPGGSQRTGSKTTFCIMDTDPIDTSLPGAPNQSVYSGCGNVVQGMSVGWGDTYGYWLAGQELDFTGNPAGVYQLEIEVDPKNLLLETNENDNVSCVLLNISTSTVTVLDSSGSCELVDVSAIVPSSARQGSTVQVTISGSGFAPGMGVSFQNGSGPRPAASNATVNGEGTTITATVTVPKRKKWPGGNNPWDVHVGPGVLIDGFTVLP